MDQATGTLHSFARQLALALEPLRDAVSDLPAFRTFMLRLGWHAQSLPAEYGELADRVTDALAALDGLPEDPSAAQLLSLLEKVRSVYQAARQLGVAPAGIDPAALLSDFAERLFDLLLADYLVDNRPAFHALLRALDILKQEAVNETDTRPGFLSTRFDWAAAQRVLRDPSAFFTEVYGWGSSEVDFHRLTSHLLGFFMAWDWPANIDRAEADLANGFDPSSHPFLPRESWRLKLPAVIDEVDGKPVEVGLAILELAESNGKLPGLIIQPLAPPEIKDGIPITDNLRAEVRAGSNLEDIFGLLLRPDGIELRYPFQPSGQLPKAGFGLSLIYAADEPILLLGSKGSSRVEFSKASLAAEVNTKGGDVELRLSAGFEALRLVISTADLDGFFRAGLGGRDATVELPLSLGWSNRAGLDFVAGLGFEGSAYPHLDLGLIRFDRVDLGVRFAAKEGEAPAIDFRVAAAVSGSLGPVSYVVDRLGFHLPVTFEQGNAGPFEIGFGFLSPTALGLVIDAGAVTGGGFVSIDPDHGRYVGMLELKMFQVAVSAVAILDTRDAAGNDLPPPGFSFFLTLSLKVPAIQLGFGFTLNGVGGFVGINRRMDSAAIVSKMREGVLDSLMFPPDPVANANTIVSNLSAIFPIAPNRYVFGPMALIGWGTPTLVEIKLAIVLEIPQPILLALLGQASIAIPAEDTAVIAINFDVVGILDFAKSTFSIDAALRDSRIAKFALAGDMAMRMAWGAKRNFALAVGGLNPHFAPPPGFPTLRRVTVALGNGDNPRITLAGYFAITSNSLQFGANAELYASRGGFSIKGWVGFDALLIFHPLSFEFDFAAGMTLSRGSTRIAGITVRGTLTGPSPFHAKGEGCISLFFFDVCVPFDATFGDREDAELGDRDPWPALEAAIKEPGNWAGELSGSLEAVVSLRDGSASAGLMVQPMAAATLRQKVLPLNRPLERFGEFEITGPKRFDMSDVVAGTDGDPDWTVATDYFAPGSFEDLSESDKLARDSFEEMAAGVSIGADAVSLAMPAVKAAKVNYETRIIDAGWKSRKLPPFRLPLDVQALAGLRGAKATSGLGNSGRGRFSGVGARSAGVTLAPERFAIASTDTLQPDPDLAAPMTRGAAYLALKASGASAGQRLQVVPVNELEEAA